ncbi:hypothetical protein N7508_006574 [Penicillium antarcticum]|uniref:uncharacterized protein n=1 Tax=Penicillium antarcticum TaxID=416450 RepID=UPI002382738D|nr:uncharacterized protein N7508_006574 [Penicillium antarcticum]KAJ5301711.1 hypothetical protein N7508_006574 [Penicillium antarcticum]
MDSNLSRQKLKISNNKYPITVPDTTQSTSARWLPIALSLACGYINSERREKRYVALKVNIPNSMFHHKLPFFENIYVLSIFMSDEKTFAASTSHSLSLAQMGRTSRIRKAGWLSKRASEQAAL